MPLEFVLGVSNESGAIAMNVQEQLRTELIRLYVEAYIKQNAAEKRMKLSTRQVRRLAKEYRQHGATALTHGNHGKVSNRKIRDDVRLRVLSLVREFYYDFDQPLQ